MIKIKRMRDVSLACINGSFDFPKHYFLLAFPAFYNWLYGMAVFQRTYKARRSRPTYINPLWTQITWVLALLQSQSLMLVVGVDAMICALPKQGLGWKLFLDIPTTFFFSPGLVYQLHLISVTFSSVQILPSSLNR